MFKKKLLALVLACTTVFSMVGCSSNEAKKEEVVLCQDLVQVKMRFSSS